MSNGQWVHLAMGRTGCTMLARDHWISKTDTVKQEADIGILRVLPVIECVHLAEVVGNTCLLAIKFIACISKVLPDTDKIFIRDHS